LGGGARCLGGVGGTRGGSIAFPQGVKSSGV